MARWIVVLCVALASLAFSAPANAAITNVFSNTPNPIPCAVQGSGVRLCDQTIAGNPGGTARSTVKTFDGVPIDVRVAFPPEPPSGPDGPYPLIMMFHGYGGTKLSLSVMQPFLNAGYATFSMTTRGFGQSCGNAASQGGRPERLRERGTCVCWTRATKFATRRSSPGCSRTRDGRPSSRSVRSAAPTEAACRCPLLH